MTVPGCSGGASMIRCAMRGWIGIAAWTTIRPLPFPYWTRWTGLIRNRNARVRRVTKNAIGATFVTFAPNRDSVRQCRNVGDGRSEEHTSELQSLMRISYAVFCLKKKKYTYDN